jgi:WD40 repeat protein
MDAELRQDSGLVLSRLLQLNEICDRYEQAARGGGVPRIEDYIASVSDSARSFLLGELLAQELELRVGRGERPAPEEYEARFPQHGAIIAAAFEHVTPAPPASDEADVHEASTVEFVTPGPSASDKAGVCEASTLDVGPDASERHPAAVLPEIPRYLVQQELGRGGMGIVFRAIQTGLRRTVALKMIRAGITAGRDDLLRFEREAKSIARMQHVNIVQIFEVARHDGLPYFSMEFVEAGSLAERLDGTPMQPRDAVALVRVLAGAIQAAHDRGVVHRDLKPANVLVAADGTPKIADFGLAVQLDAKDKLTASSAIVGTPSYMAPEQARGRSGSIGTSVDVYALGAILYELVTGRPPFRAATPLDTILQVLDAEPVSPRSLVPNLPRAVDTIILACLRKQPGQRYESARALADDLDRWLAGTPIRMRPVGPIVRSLLWVKRHPAIAGLILMTTCAATLAAVGFVWRQRAAESAAAKEAETARAEAILHAERLAMARREFDAGHLLEANEYLDRCVPPLRNWEWYYLKRRFQGAQVSVDTWGGGLAFHPDGSRIVTWGQVPDGRRRGSQSHDASVNTWDAASGKRVREYGGGPRRVYYAAFSPGGTRLVAAGLGRIASDWTPYWKPWGSVALPGDVEVWDTETGEKIVDWHDSGKDYSPGAGVALSRDGRRIAGSGRDGVLIVRDVVTGREVWSDGQHANGTNTLAMSPDGAYLASSDSRGEIVIVRDAATGSGPRSLRRHLPGPAELTFGPDGRFLLASPGSGVQQGAEVWDLASDREVLCLQRPTTYLAFSPDGSQLLVAVPDGVITARTLDEHDPGRGAWRLSRVSGSVVDLALGPEGKYLVAAASQQGRDRIRPGGASAIDVSCWDISSRRQRLAVTVGSRFDRDLQLQFPQVGPFALDPEGKYLACAAGPLSVRNAATGQDIWIANDAPAPIAVAFAPDGRRLASLSDEGRLGLWDVTNDMDVPVQRLGPFRPVCAEVSPDGDHVAALDEQGMVWTGLLSSGRPLASSSRRAATNGFIRLLPVFSPDVRRVAEITKDGASAALHVLESGQATSHLRGQEGNFIGALAFSADGNRLATGHWDLSIAIWDASDVRRLASVTDDAAFVTRLLFSADGRRLVSATEDGEVKVRSVEGLPGVGPPRFPFGHMGPSSGLRDPQARLDALAISPDGARVAAVGSNGYHGGRGVIEVWDADTGRTAYSLPVGTVWAIAFTPDGTRLATASDQVRLLDAKTGDRVWDLSRVPSRVLRLAFVQKGHRLVALCEDGARVWDARPL